MLVEMNPERVRELRKEKWMSKRDLAAAAGSSMSTARRAERGAPVQETTARRVLAVFGEKPSPSLGRPLKRA